MSMKNSPHPGKSVRVDCLEPCELTVTAGAKILGVSRQTLNNLVNENSGISPEMAIRLSKAFGSTAESWLRMQLAYDLSQTLKNEHKIKVQPFRMVVSDDVIMLPGLDEYFYTSLWNMQVRSGYYPSLWEHPLTHVSSKSWINRGDTLFSIRIQISFFDYITVNIKSPVSGIKLFDCLSFYINEPNDSDFERHGILIPENEPAPELDYVYGELDDVFFKHIEYIHKCSKKLKGSARYKPYNSEELAKLRESMKDLKYKKGSLQKNFKDHIPDIKKAFPEINFGS